VYISVRCTYVRAVDSGSYFAELDTSQTLQKFRTLGKAMDACDMCTYAEYLIHIKMEDKKFQIINYLE